MPKTLVLLSIFVLVSLSKKCTAQLDTAMLKEKLWAYTSQHPTTNLFVHTDKNIYAPNERIWFKAYVLSGPIIDSKVLYVRLLDANKKVTLSAAYPMYDIRGHGDLLLPDTLKDGDYFFCAYTDRMINFSPQDVFIQSVRIHKNRKRWRATAYVRDTAMLKRGENAEIIVKLMQNNDLVKGVKGHYQLIDSNDVVKQGGLKTNLVGESFIQFTYPKIKDNHTLTARIYFEDDNDYEEVLLNLGHEGNTLSAQVFPEGSHAIEGVQNNMAVQVSDVNQSGVQGASVAIKSGSKILTTAVTNSLGIASLSFTPVVGEQYNLEIKSKGKIQFMPLPVTIEKSGYALQVSSKAGKSIVSIYNHQAAETVSLLAHTYDQILWCKQLKIPANTQIEVDAAIDTLPKDVIVFTLLDSNGNYLAERLWMNNATEPCSVELYCDKAHYGTRQKVTVNVVAKDEKGNPAKINSSVSIAEIHTIDTADIPEITDRYYFKNTGTPWLQLYRQKWLAANINTCLLTRTWGDCKWDEVYNYQPTDGVRVIKNSDGVYGNVEPLNRKKKVDLKQLSILSKDKLSLATLDDNGTFSIPSDELISTSNYRRSLLLGTSFYDKYKIEIRNYDQEFDKRIAKQEALYPVKEFNTYTEYKMQALEQLTDKHELQNVVVRKTKDIPWSSGEFKSTTCHDWVCMYNVLNCPNHPFGTIPVDGELYKFKGGSVVYRGCGNSESRSVIPLKMVYMPNAFPLIDYDKNPSNEEDLNTTIYWNPNLNTDADGKASFSFFTNDLKSSFIIRLQGITVHGLRPVVADKIVIVK